MAEHLPDCSSTLLESLTWAVYDGVLSLGSTPCLEGGESWGKVIKYLADKVFKGLCTHCPTHTSAVFKKDEQTEWPELTAALHCHHTTRLQQSWGSIPIRRYSQPHT